MTELFCLSVGRSIRAPTPTWPPKKTKQTKTHHKLREKQRRCKTSCLRMEDTHVK